MPIPFSIKVIESWHPNADRILPPNGGFIVCAQTVLFIQRGVSPCRPASIAKNSRN